MEESDEESEPFEPNPVADDDDILGINAMLAALDSDEEDSKKDESEDDGMEEVYTYIVPSKCQIFHTNISFHKIYYIVVKNE